ncbi:DUF5994 family protein [Terrabacter sp. Root181]|uniref:DUF5994 family protein n=1 Tax=Terrabacter sp. Root181 TaxID=1736484 RepID=UPI0006FD2DB6|nr:DUF5994 family protein [Terrabacter sp. Root181]KRB44218.1 hypothetical protein ASD90_17575 [Terrabacter sp. Root181]
MNALPQSLLLPAAVDGEMPANGLPSRLSLSDHPGVNASDGGWWPRSTDLRVEVPLLDVAVHDRTNARIARFGYERTGWAEAPRRVGSPIGITHLGWFEHSRFPDHVLLSLSNYGRLVLTVVPPDTEEETARTALATARD